MPSHRQKIAPVLAALIALTGCGHTQQLVVKHQGTRVLKSPTRGQDDYAGLAFVIAGKRAADEKLWNDTLVWNKFVEAAKLKVRAGTGSRTAHPPAAASSVDWDCVAVAETGGNYSMHGSHYSSAYGVMNEAVREHAPPDVAARILNGTASKEEQLAMASQIPFSGWAASTQAKCSR